MHYYDIRRLRMAHAKGMSVAELAEQFKCCEATVEKFIASGAQGQPLSEGELKVVIAQLKETPSIGKASQYVALSPPGLKHLLLPHAERVLAETGYDLNKSFEPKARFDKRTLASMLDLFEGGQTQPELAKWYKVSVPRIQQLLNKARRFRKPTE